MNNKRTLVNLYRYIVLVTRVRIFCTTLFTKNNIKVVIQMHTFLMDHKKTQKKRGPENVHTIILLSFLVVNDAKDD